jgi:TolA-binding protein
MVVLVLMSAGLAGCLWTSASHGSELDETTAAHTRRLNELEQGQAAVRAQMESEVAQATATRTELQGVLEQATQVLRRNSADTGVQVQELQAQLAALEGQLAELRNANELLTHQLTQQRGEMDERITQVARKAGIDMPVAASEIPADPSEHYAAAYRAYTAADYSRARALFREYVTRHGNTDQADNAQYWIGASYLAEGRPATALGELGKVLRDYASGDAVDETLLDMAEAYWRQHACADARTALEGLIRTQASSPLVARARERLREVQHPARGYCQN